MAELNVRGLVIDKLSEEIGVLGGVIVDDVLTGLGLGMDGLNDRRHVAKFLAQLKNELPEDLESSKVIEDIRVAIYFRGVTH